MSSNSISLSDEMFNEYPDWFEIYNNSSSPIFLKGYYFTDNISNETKWQVKDNIVILPHDFLVFYADGKDTLNHTNFKLSASGEELAIYSPDTILVDSVTFGPQLKDMAYCRENVNSNKWVLIDGGTPNKENNKTSYDGYIASVPYFSIHGGFFDNEISLKLKNFFAGEIRYTVDGSEPLPSSTLYVHPITISKTTIIRARIFKQDMLPGPVVTNTYFVGYDVAKRNLPVVSISTAPENFWDPTEGIYVQDFKPDWEVPINIEFFENDGSDRAAFNLCAETKVNGLYSWQLPQKMLGVYFKKKYGESKLQYPLFEDAERKSFKNFALRASGSDWSYTLFRDILGQGLSYSKGNIDIQKYRTCVVYVNGQYMGIHNIREKVDEDYIKSNYSLDGGTFDLIENQSYVEEGSLDNYRYFMNLYKKDLSNNDNYSAVSELFDIENFSDYISAEVYTGNSSIDHNVMSWKPKNSGKWRWILMDLDRGCFTHVDKMLSFYAEKSVLPLGNLMKNDQFNSYFFQRLVTNMYAIYNPDIVKQFINERQSIISYEMTNHVERWLGRTSSYGNALKSVNHWKNNVAKLYSYAEVRPSIILSDITKYGIGKPATLMLTAYPDNAATFSVSDFEIPLSDVIGAFSKKMNAEFSFKAKSGYEFQGWVEAKQNAIITKKASWRYSQSSFSSNTWTSVDYNDTDWKTARGIIGYGNTGIETDIGLSSNPTTVYFRKSFTLSSIQDIHKLYINLLRDDAAVVYINGVEVVRSNIGDGVIKPNSIATYTTSGVEELVYIPFVVDEHVLHEGENCIAVEIHNFKNNDVDMSFDLELVAVEVPNSEFISKSEVLTRSILKNTVFMAVFGEDKKCSLPDTLTYSVFKNECPFYTANDRLVIPENVNVSIGKGVEIRLPENAQIYVQGSLSTIGTKSQPVIFTNLNENNWGALNFIYSRDTSFLNNTIIIGASSGEKKNRDVAAINLFHSAVFIDSSSVTDVGLNPVHARYSYLHVTNSSFYSKVTGDLINAKYGKAYIENCSFEGNNMPDTDAIDYDDIENGEIRNCTIMNFKGFNSDAIDIGEQAKNITIDNVFVRSITDKGVSVGQQSSASITNSTFIGCNLGLGLKDSCSVFVNNCNFYGNAYAIACYEKNEGRAGGNAEVMNSVLTNCSEHPFMYDEKSKLAINNSISDKDNMQELGDNQYGNPYFEAPEIGNFTFLNSSPCLYAGNSSSSNKNIGKEETMNYEPNVIITSFFLNPADASDMPQFIEITNVGDSIVNVGEYEIDRGVTLKLPKNVQLNLGERMYVTDNANHTFWKNKYEHIFQWTKGKLSSNGESIQLKNEYGMVVDYIKYNDNSNWPLPPFLFNKVFVLNDTLADNNFGENWIAKDYSYKPTDIETFQPNGFSVYPIFANDVVTIKSDTKGIVNIYSILGEHLDAFPVQNGTIIEKNLKMHKQSQLIINLNNKSILVLVR